jgi:hypothetical protein
LGDADDSTGGQYSSLADLSRIAQVFLSPKAPNKEHQFLSALMREWLRPVHIWPNGNEAVGAPWEITYLPPSLFGGSHFSKSDFYGQFGEGKTSGHRPHTARIPIYSKSRSVLGYQSLFSLNPEYGNAAIVLTTGSNPQPATLTLDTLRRLQPVFQEHLLNQLEEAYVGTWEAHWQRDGEDANDVAEVGILVGQMFFDEVTR